jgi:hypothetical protein
MSEYEIRALDASTWDPFARLAEKHNGCGFGGYWCTWFHSREGRPEGEMGRPWKERLVREGKAHAGRSSSTAPRAASSRRSASATSDPRERRTA